MKSTLKISLLAAFALLGAGAARTIAAPTFISPAQGRGADLAVRGGNFAGGSFGDLDILRLRNTADLGNARKIYLRFDLASLPSNIKTASGATLGLQLAPAEGKSPVGKIWTFNVFGLRNGVAGESWSEKAATWNDVPANNAKSPLDLTADAAPLGTFTLSGSGLSGQKIAFSSPQMLQFLQSDTNGTVTLILTRQESSDGEGNDVTHVFASKEYASPAPPVLSVAFGGESAALPTPTQWAALPVAPKALPYESDIANFEAADRQNPPAKGGILFVGSSSIRLWESLKQDFPNYRVLNRGFGGSEIIDSVHFADRIVTPYQPKMIVFYAGTNDLANGKTPQILLADYMTFVAAVRAKMPTVPIAFISVAPAPSRWSNVENIRKANQLIEQFTRLAPNLKFIDIFPLMLDAGGAPRPELFVGDQLHMKPAGYAIWTKAVAPYLPAP